MILATKSVTRSRKCGICGERLYNEDALCVMDGDRMVAVYCEHHNVDDIHVMHPIVPDNLDELSREDFARYQNAGIPLEEYFRDRDAGYAY